MLSYTCNQLAARGFDRNGAANMASPPSTPSTDPTQYLGSDKIPLAVKRTGYHYIDELPKGKPGSKCANVNCICASIITTSRRSVKLIALISHRTFIGARCSFASGVTRGGTPRKRSKHLSYKKINQERTKPINNDVQSYVFLIENCFRG